MRGEIAKLLNRKVTGGRRRGSAFPLLLPASFPYLYFLLAPCRSGPIRARAMPVLILTSHPCRPPLPILPPLLYSLFPPFRNARLLRRSGRCRAIASPCGAPGALPQRTPVVERGAAGGRQRGSTSGGSSRSRRVAFFLSFGSAPRRACRACGAK